MSEQRTGKKRKPFTLQLSEDDQDIIDWLSDLAPGTKQGEVKAALRARMGQPRQAEGGRLARIEQALADLPEWLDARLARLGTVKPQSPDERKPDELAEIDQDYIANISRARRPGFRPKD